MSFCCDRPEVSGSISRLLDVQRMPGNFMHQEKNSDCCVAVLLSVSGIVDTILLLSWTIASEANNRDRYYFQ